jgi:type II secretory pathway pseudopilin PulG
MTNARKIRPFGLRTAAFSLIEVMMAAVIISLVFVSSIAALGRGFQMLETARNNTLASQVLQSEMENLRLLNWAKLMELAPSVPMTQSFAVDSSFAETVGHKFVGERRIESLGEGDTRDMRKITLTVSWTSSNGKANRRTYVTYFGKDGINDFYYRKL